MKLSITAITLTFNEEINLENCLKSISGLVSRIIVVDSYSKDRTVEIAKRYGAEVIEHAFKNQADQFNWALQNIKITTDWILRLDADEEILPELGEELQDTLTKTPDDITGFYIKRRTYFMGRWIKHGGYYPTWILRLWRNGAGKIEDREMDEHAILLRGKSAKLNNDFIDNNKKNLESWVAKHNNFSTREARERLRFEDKKNTPGKLSGVQAERKRWLKDSLYLKLPFFWRAFAYFFYRYFLRFGFLDGKEGLIFHFLQGCSHQFLIDAKTYEAKNNVGRS